MRETAKCDRCHQPCAPAGEGRALLRAVFKAVLNARLEAALIDAQVPLLCRACYLVHAEMLGAAKAAEVMAKLPYEQVVRYEQLVDRASSRGEKPPAPAEFFSRDTLDGKTLDAQWFNRMNKAIREARGSARGTQGDM